MNTGGNTPVSMYFRAIKMLFAVKSNQVSTYQDKTFTNHNFCYHD
jgi:hypothetical protein